MMGMVGENGNHFEVFFLIGFFFGFSIALAARYPVKCLNKRQIVSVQLFLFDSFLFLASVSFLLIH